MAKGSGTDLPQKVGHFRPIALLGVGGMGVVYLAEDVEIPGRRIAIKLLRADGVFRSLKDLRREAMAVTSLQHPHIVVVHEIGESPEGPFLVMEYLAGGSLADRIAAGTLTRIEALRFARQTAEALETAHRGGILHCDIKPSNLLLTSEGHVKVADFGLAAGPTAASAQPEEISRVETESILPLRHDRIAGTPGYMAPELLEGSPPGPKSDQFAFGVTLHQLLAGRHPFEGVPWTDMVRGKGARIETSLPADLRRIVERCLHPDAAARHPSMGDVAKALRAGIDRRDPVRRRRRYRAAALAVALLGVAIVWPVSRWLAHRKAMKLNEQGVAAFSAGNFESAFQLFSQARLLDPGFEAPCGNLGMLSLEEHRFDRAVTILRDCAARFHDSAAVLAGLGRASRDAGDVNGAAKALRKALELKPAPEIEILAANELALTLMDRGEMVEAVAVLRSRRMPKAHTLEGAVLRKTLGLALLGTGNPSEAAEVFQQALEGPLRGEFLSRALSGLGCSLEQLGDVSGARKAFSRALLEAPGTLGAQEAVKGLDRLSGSPSSKTSEEVSE